MAKDKDDPKKKKVSTPTDEKPVAHGQDAENTGKGVPPNPEAVEGKVRDENDGKDETMTEKDAGTGLSAEGGDEPRGAGIEYFQVGHLGSKNGPAVIFYAPKGAAPSDSSAIPFDDPAVLQIVAGALNDGVVDGAPLTRGGLSAAARTLALEEAEKRRAKREEAKAAAANA